MRMTENDALHRLLKNKIKNEFEFESDTPTKARFRKEDQRMKRGKRGRKKKEMELLYVADYYAASTNKRKAKSEKR